MKDVQQIGHTYANAEAFVGLPRQLTVETDNWTLRLHDGVQPGGFSFTSKEYNDGIYQAKSTELSALGAVGVGVAGFLTRVGPGAYQYRTITGTAGEITVTNGSGADGAPTLSLPSQITKAITWTALQTFSGGIAGNVTGNLTGNSTGTHNGPVTGDVTGNLQGNSEGNHVGGLDARGALVYFDPGQIPAAAVADLISFMQGLAGVPAGAITGWSGDVASIPAGWALCDGGNGTPDLRDRFLIGAGGAYAPGATGGAANRTPAGTITAAGSHTHTGTVGDTALTIAQMPAHTHLNGVVDNTTVLFNHGAVGANPAPGSSIESNGSQSTHEGTTTSTGGGAVHSHGLTIDESGNHTHLFEGTEASNLPPYFALCYIMKL